MKKIKLKGAKDNKKNIKRNVKMSKIINSELFFEKSGILKLALNKNRLIKRDFGLRRVKKKVDAGKVKKKDKEEEDDSFNDKYKENEVPFELADIIEKNEIKFDKGNLICVIV